MTSVAATGSGFVAVGTSGSQPLVWTSANGSHWNRAAPALGGTPQTFNDLAAHGSQVLLAVAGSTGGINGTYWRSPDGGAWQRSGTVTSDLSATISLAVAGGSAVAAGTGSAGKGSAGKGSQAGAAHRGCAVPASATAWLAARSAAPGGAGDGRRCGQEGRVRR